MYIIVTGDKGVTHEGKAKKAQFTHSLTRLVITWANTNVTDMYIGDRRVDFYATEKQARATNK